MNHSNDIHFFISGRKGKDIRRVFWIDGNEDNRLSY